jgi:putative NADPH-quinone reductase
VRVLVIFAHPRGDSFCAAAHATVLQALRSAGHEVDDLDLYAEGFDPVLSAGERAAYHTEGENLGGIGPYAARLRAAEALVICTPTWWYGMPAILKGYFDRVWVPGVAFSLAPAGRGLTGRLTQIRKLAVVTTYGSPRWFIALVMRDPGRRVLTTGLRRLLAPRAQVSYLALYGLDTASAARRGRFLARVGRRLAAF